MKKTRLLTLSITLSLLIAGGLITSVVADAKPLPIKIITPTLKSIDPPMP